jgi:ATPase subunit of ABC transporter with duplicated ATPase domains
MPYALCLAGIPIALPHMLLLDEPTNHLDIESIEVYLSPYTLCLMSYDERTNHLDIESIEACPHKSTCFTSTTVQILTPTCRICRPLPMP